MVDEFKSVRDSLFKLLTGRPAPANGGEAGDDDQEDGDEGGSRAAGGRAGLLDASTARALLQTVFSKAGKSKDELVQILAREIGVAVAAMLREPLAELAKHRKLQISFEFVPKDGKAQPGPGGRRAGKRRRVRRGAGGRATKKASGSKDE